MLVLSHLKTPIKKTVSNVKLKLLLMTLQVSSKVFLFTVYIQSYNTDKKKCNYQPKATGHVNTLGVLILSHFMTPIKVKNSSNTKLKLLLTILNVSS